MGLGRLFGRFSWLAEESFEEDLEFVCLRNLKKRIFLGMLAKKTRETEHSREKTPRNQHCPASVCVFPFFFSFFPRFFFSYLVIWLWRLSFSRSSLFILSWKWLDIFSMCNSCCWSNRNKSDSCLIFMLFSNESFALPGGWKKIVTSQMRTTY